MKTKTILLLSILAFLSIVLFAYTQIAANNIVYMHEVPASVEVGTHVGIDVTSDYLQFGEVRPGGYSEKTITVQNANYIVLSDKNKDSWINIREWIEMDGAHEIRLRARPKGEEQRQENTTVYIYGFKDEPGFVEEIFMIKGKQIGFVEENDEPNVFINITR